MAYNTRLIRCWQYCNFAVLFLTKYIKYVYYIKYTEIVNNTGVSYEIIDQGALWQQGFA